jgi:hypothetical protein
MSGFWPAGLDVSDTEAPKTILEAARSEWESQSKGALTLVFQEATSQSGNKMIIVHAKYIPGSRTSSLFSVVHRPKTPYPVTIQPEKENLPDFLKKSYYQPGLSETATVSFRGHEVENRWVSDTPAEFRSKLKEAFNLGSVKREVLSLVSYSPPAEDDTAVAEDSEPSSEKG